MAIVNKRALFGWAMFDVANSAYTTVVITVVYSAFFVGYIVPPDSAWGNSWWALAVTLSSVGAMVLAPLLGNWVDHFGGKKRMLLGNMWLCAASTALLYWVEPGMVLTALTLLTISNLCWMLSEVFCASYLTDIADEKSMGWISGLGWGVGYLGGLVSLIMVLFGVITAPPQQLDIYIEQNQLAMVAVALFFVVVSLPTFLWLPEPRPYRAQVQRHRLRSLIQFSWHQFLSTKRLAAQLPVLSKFLLIFTLYSAGMATVIKFFGIYVESELAMTGAEKTQVFLALQVSAFAGSLLFGLLENRIGAKFTVLFTLLWWLAGLVAIHQLQGLSDLLALPENQVFTICTVVAGAGLGATQSASRTIIGLLSPKQHSGQLFGYWGFAARLATIVGTVLFAFIADLFTTRQALIVVMLFFGFGALLLLTLSIEQGRIQAAELKE